MHEILFLLFFIFDCARNRRICKTSVSVVLAASCNFVLIIATLPITEDRVPVKVHQLSLAPHPLRLRQGERFTLRGMFTVAEPAGTKYKIDLTVYKKALFGWIRVPCFGHW